MSVLVFDGKSVAADGASNDGQILVPTEKLWQYGEAIIGGVGSVHDVSAMRDWVLGGRKREAFPKNLTASSNFVYVSKTRGLVRYTASPLGIIHGFNKVAFGSGRDVAYGALGMNATARQAVELAIRYTTHCGGEILEFGL